MPQWTGKWAGGRTYQSKRGQTVYQLEKAVRGRRYSIKLDADSEQAAMAELALFDRDPAGYQTKAQAGRSRPMAGPLYVDPETVEGFITHLQKGQRSEVYQETSRRYLAQWAEALKDRDLRTVTLYELRQHLAKWTTATPSRIIAIKSFCSWLRSEDRLKASEDPTLELKVPPSVAEKGSRTKGYSIEHVETIYAALDSQVARDIIAVKAKTGMHVSEIERIANGNGELHPLADTSSGIAGTAKFKHKNGRIHIASLDAQAFAAAQRLQRKGRLPARFSLQCMIDRAAEGCGQPTIHPSELRHSFATWAKNYGELIKPTSGGVALEIVASILGHQSTRTTTKFYDGTEVPPMVRIPIKLVHPNDPVPGAPEPPFVLRVG
jgi:integrase